MYSDFRASNSIATGNRVAGHALRAMMIALSPLAALMVHLYAPAVQAQAGDDFFDSGAPPIFEGDIGVPVPTGRFDGRPEPGCWVAFASGPGILGPTCAIRCVGVAAEDVPSYQATCELSGSLISDDDAPHHGVFPQNEDGSFGVGQDVPPDDGTPFCEFFRAPRNDPGDGRVFFPNGHPRCMGVVGDPHLTTFDGVRYDLQAGGEFVVARSLDDGFEVQARMEPHGLSKTVSITTAVAVSVPPYRISVTLKHDTPLRINGEPQDLPEGEYLILPDAEAMVLRQAGRYSVVLSDGTNVHVDLFGQSMMNLFVLLAEARDGRVVGLGASGDGDDMNDFVTADGSVLANWSAPDTLYGQFAESWRVSEATSLFDYGPGESYAGFQDPNMPYEHVSMNDIPLADRNNAETQCHAAGLNSGPALDDCIYDYALTGDEIFIQSALSTQAPPEFISVTDAVTLDAPESAGAGATIEIGFSGPAGQGRDLITVTSPDDPPGTYNDFHYASGGSPATVRMPFEAGEYELRYVQVGETVLARRAITIEPVTATITGPQTAIAGETIAIEFSGPPAGVGDWISVAAPDAAPGAYSDYQYTREGSPASVRMPLDSGEYELRFVQGNQRILMRERITVTPASATLAAPDSAAADSTLSGPP